MTIEKRYELSCYEELTQLAQDKKMWLVKHNETDVLYIKKELTYYNSHIYDTLQKNKFPNVPKIVFLAREEDKLIVIEEYIHGSSIEQLLEEEGVFSEETVIQITNALCDILHPLHTSEPPIIHRDLKPSNIILSNDNIVKLIDFNAAKEFHPSQNKDTTLMGTRNFAAPEQYGFGASDSRTDIYALGITMYYMLTKDYPDSHSYHGRLSPVIEKCIHMEKEKRYDNVQALQRDLQSLLSSPTITKIRGMHKNTHPTKPESSNNILTTPCYDYHESFPVGYRSGKIWKMILATLGYLGILNISFTTQVKDQKGNLYTGLPLLINQISILFLFLGYVFFFGNYRNIRNRLPWMQRGKLLHFIFSIIYAFLYFLIIIILLVMFENT